MLKYCVTATERDRNPLRPIDRWLSKMSLLFSRLPRVLCTGIGRQWTYSAALGYSFFSTHVDSNVPGNPSYHFKVVKPGTPPVAGWGSRDTILETDGVGKGTLCVHAGCAPDPAHHAVMVPIYMSSTFAFNDVCTTAGYDYTRSGNPTRAALEKAIAMLEGGSGAAATSTGMSAVLLALNLLPKGSHIICTIDCYGGTFRTMQHAVNTYGLRVTYVDLRDHAAFEKAFIKGQTKMVWVETPSNPLLRVTDVAPIARASKAGGAMVVVDNTFLSPALFRPFEHGADLVIHSTTKYLVRRAPVRLKKSLLKGTFYMPSARLPPTPPPPPCICTELASHSRGVFAAAHLSPS